MHKAPCPPSSTLAGQGSYTLAGRDPAQGGTTTIPTVLVPSTLSFDAKKTAGKPFSWMQPRTYRAVLRSPVFSNFAFPSGGTTQYADAMLRTTFPKAEGWHTLLGKPEVKPSRSPSPRATAMSSLRRKPAAHSPSSTSSFCRRNSSSSFPNRTASWSSP